MPTAFAICSKVRPVEKSCASKRSCSSCISSGVNAFNDKSDSTSLSEISSSSPMKSEGSNFSLCAGTFAARRSVFNHTEDREEDEKESDEGYAEFMEGESVMISGHSLVQKKTMPKALFTEATLLTAMETAGKTIADEALREAMKEQSLGTPATRAAIISTLFKREYIERSGKSLYLRYGQQ